MLRLLESGTRPPVRVGWTLGSSFAHGSLIAVAVMMTMREPAPPVPELRTETLVYARRDPQRPTGGVPGVRGRISRPVLPSIPLPAIPGINFDVPPRLGGESPDLARMPVGGGGWEGTTPGVGAGEVHALSQVDRAVAPRRDNPRPDYPASLRAASVEGDALVRFVVDTTGAVEPGSVTILRATHVLFADAVRRWLPRTRYAAAEVRGRRVRQLVEQRVAFELRR